MYKLIMFVFVLLFVGNAFAQAPIRGLFITDNQAGVVEHNVYLWLGNDPVQAPYNEGDPVPVGIIPIKVPNVKVNAVLTTGDTLFNVSALNLEPYIGSEAYMQTAGVPVNSIGEFPNELTVSNVLKLILIPNKSQKYEIRGYFELIPVE